MLNPFEKALELDDETANSKKRAFLSSMEKSETVFVPVQGGAPRWRCKRHGIFILLSADFKHGTMLIDVPLGVTVTGEHAAKLLAFASFGEAFRYETGVFRAMRAGEVVGLEEGAEIHMLFERPTELGNLDSVIERAADRASDSKEIFQKVATGMSLKDAMAFDEDMRDFFRMLADHLSDEDEDD